MPPILFAMLCALSLLLQGCADQAFFQPERPLSETPARYHLPFEEVSFPSRDGTRLSGWFVPATGPARGTVLHLHGSYGNQGYAFRQVHWLPREGFNLLTFDYRGYGRSEGRPSRQGAYEDGLAAIRYLAERPGIDHESIAVFGQSLGGALAIAAAGNTSTPVRAVASEGAFYSYRTQAGDRMLASTREKVGNLPFLAQQILVVSRLAVTDTHSPGEAISRLSPMPVLIIHGRQDALVSYQHGERLYEAAGEPKALWPVDPCGHLEAFTTAPSHRENRRRLVQFFREAFSGR